MHVLLQYSGVVIMILIEMIGTLRFILKVELIYHDTVLLKVVAKLNSFSFVVVDLPWLLLLQCSLSELCLF